MPIVVTLDVMLARRKMKLGDLAAEIGITPQNLSVLKTGRAKAIRFATLEALCRALRCTPGDLLAYERDADDMPEAPDVLATQPTARRTGT